MHFMVIWMIPVFSSILKKNLYIFQVVFQKLKVFLMSAVMCQPHSWAVTPRKGFELPFLTSLVAVCQPREVSSSLLSFWELCKALEHPKLPNNFLWSFSFFKTSLKTMSWAVCWGFFMKCIFNWLKLNKPWLEMLYSYWSLCCKRAALTVVGSTTWWVVSSCPMRCTQPESALLSQQL